MKEFNKFQIKDMGGFWGLKRASAHFDVPQSSLTIVCFALKPYTFVAACISAFNFSVQHVLMVSSLSQIGKSIVVWIPIAVIKVLGPFARHVQPRQMMAVIANRIYANQNVSIFSRCAGRRCYWISVPQGTLQPPKQPNFRVIAHKLLQPTLRDSRVFGIHEMGRPSARIRLAIKSPLSGQTLNGLALIPRIAV